VLGSVRGSLMACAAAGVLVGGMAPVTWAAGRTHPVLHLALRMGSKTEVRTRTKGGTQAQLAVRGTARGRVVGILAHSLILRTEAGSLLILAVGPHTRVQGRNRLRLGATVHAVYRVRAWDDLALRIRVMGGRRTDGPLPRSGRLYVLRGLIASVTPDGMTLDLAGGVTADLTLTAQTRTHELVAPSSTPGQAAPAAGDFATVRAEAAGTTLAALDVRYGPSPAAISAPRFAVAGQIRSLSAGMVTVQPVVGVTLPVSLGSDTRIRVGGEAAPATQLAAGMRVRVRGWRFDGVLYAGTVVAEQAPTAQPAAVTVPLPPGAPQETPATLVATFSQSGQAEVTESLPLSDLSQGRIVFAPPPGLAAGTWSVAVNLTYPEGRAVVAGPVLYSVSTQT
jgi:hypothetical protein